MKKYFIAFLLLFIFFTSNAGHHFETELAKKYPMYDMTDVFCFPSSNAGMTTFIMDFNPQASKDSSFYKNFGNKNGYRQLHLGFDKDFKTGISLGFSFYKNKIHIYSISSADPELGNLGTELGSGELNTIITLSNGIKVWAGVVKDPFNGNGEALYGKFKPAVDAGKWDEDAYRSLKGHDLFEKAKIVSIVIDVPNTMLGNKIYYHATSVAKIKGTEKGHRHAHWHRINRIAHVLLPHLYMETMNDREKQNAGDIKDDEMRRENCMRMIEKYTTAAKSQADPKAYAKKMTDLLLPDYIPYVIGTPAHYSMPEINGRNLTDQAMDCALEILVGKPFSNETRIKTENFTNSFPYLMQDK